MTNPFASSIQELIDSMKRLHDTNNTSGSFDQFKSLLTNSSPQSPSPELSEIISHVQSQYTYTKSTSTLLHPILKQDATFADLTTATNLIQLYFQGTQPFDQIFSNLVSNLVSIKFAKIEEIKKGIETIAADRKNLQKTLDRILQKFSSQIEELNIDALFQSSIDTLLGDSQTILNDLLNLPSPNNPNPTDVIRVVKNFIDHLKKARDTFKKFDRKGISLDNSDVGKLKKLIGNWEKIIETLQIVTRNENLSISTDSRNAIAQSIEIHELLEENYGYLSDLIRSGDLVSPGIL